MAQRIDRKDLEVQPDDSLVLKNAGPEAADTPEAGYFPIPTKLARAVVKDMIWISDACMSETAFGTIILQGTSEAAVGGALAPLETGDRVRLSVREKRLDPTIEDVELSRRRRLSRLIPLPHRGCASLYAREVQQADLGAIFHF